MIKRMHSNDLKTFGKKGFIPKSNFWCVFDVFLDLVILVYFNAISIDFCAIKCFICINYVYILFIIGKMLI